MESDPTGSNDIAALKRRIAELEAAQRRIEQGEAGRALDERAVHVGGNNENLINTGLSIIEHYHADGTTRLTKEEIAQRVGRYLEWLREHTGSILLRGIERSGKDKVVRLPLETAYVSLRARSAVPVGDIRMAKNAGSGAKFADSAEFSENQAAINCSQVLGLSNQLVIVGGAGSGKTTVLLHMAWALTVSLLTGQSEPVRSRLGLNITPHELPLPILVTLAGFARYRRGLPNEAPAHEKTLSHFISHQLIMQQAGFDLPADFFVQLLSIGRDVTLLLDGLDEVANENERAEIRQSIEQLVSGRPAMRVVVTCRTIAYRGGRTALGADFLEIAVQPLDVEQHVEPMVRQAYECIYSKDAVRRAERTKDLLRGIRWLEEQRRARLGNNVAPLVDSPLMVRLLLIVHLNNRDMPDDRAELFDKAIGALLQVDYGLEEADKSELSMDWRLHREAAQHLAFHMHKLGLDRGCEIAEPELKAALREEPEFERHISTFVRYANERGSLLEERDGAYRFTHLAFQEFLAARYLREIVGGGGREAILAFLRHRLDDPWWREPILLLAGYLAASSAKSARDFITALAQAGDDANAEFSAAELAATAALERRESGESVRKSCAGRILSLLENTDTLIRSRPVVRARALVRLSQLGDSRFDPQCFYLPVDSLLGFVHVAADPGFRIGTRKADVQRIAEIGCEAAAYEINDALTPSPEFYVARYPVTVAQFGAFAAATGIKNRYDDALRHPATKPVRWISWHEALDYCDWLNERLANSELVANTQAARLVRAEGWRVSLPSELEWEKAARGGLRDTIFSWGNEPDPNCANYGDTNIGDTSVVGCFPANGSGLYDMIGNVWEWTRRLKGACPYEPNDSKHEDVRDGNQVHQQAHQIVRGGSFFLSRDLARCACRLRYPADARYYSVGFRVVLCSALSVENARDTAMHR